MMLLQAAAEVPPVVVVSNWPSAITSIFTGLIGAVPALAAAYGIYRSTVNSNSKVEQKTAEINTSVAAQTTEITQKVEAKAADTTAQFEAVQTKLDENTTLTKDLKPQLVNELNDRIARHKANNEKQLAILREEFKKDVARLESEFKRIIAGASPADPSQPPTNG